MMLLIFFISMFTFTTTVVSCEEPISFTFGIITHCNQETFVNQIVDSIERENIPEYEILIIGSCNIERNNTRVIPFDENLKPMWITRKKNLITQHARHENIVYMHDYIVLEPGWYAGWLQFGNNFHVAMNKINNIDGTRFRDWCLLFDDKIPDLPDVARLLPYHVSHLTKYMYISGAYWVAKKDVMQNFPLDEEIVWGGAEDLDWSMRIRQHFDFSMNANSSVKIIKAGKVVVFRELNAEELTLVESL